MREAVTLIAMLLLMGMPIIVFAVAAAIYGYKPQGSDSAFGWSYWGW